MVLHLHSIQASEARSAASTFSCGGKTITLDLSKNTIMAEGGSLALLPVEAKMIHYLAEHAGYVCTKQMILNYLHARRRVPLLKLVDVRICLIREKLRDAGLPNFITTVHGRGYCIGSSTYAAELVKDWVHSIRVRSVRGPKGQVYGREHFDSLFRTTRWTPRRKSVLMALYFAGIVEESNIFRLCGDLSETEFEEWKAAYIADRSKPSAPSLPERRLPEAA